MPARREVLIAAAAATGLGGCAMTDVRTFPSLASARAAVEGLLAGGWKHTGSFTLAQMLEHAAQSVEYSLNGFPQAKSAVFQATVGRAAFAVFDARGAMSHGLDEPIPGAPALSLALPAAAERLLTALKSFEAHTGVLAPHFAYGELDKGQYTRAHLMHLANHWAEVVRA
jgi:Protein of unknown function (DUF1569)